MSIDSLKGTGVALVTPMNKDYTVDYEGLKRMLHHVSDGGVDYLVVLGTTGESPTFNWKEKMEIMEFVFDNNTKDLPIVFGHGGNNTGELISRLEDLRSFPLTGLLSTSPYYSKPSQEGIYRHYMAIADSSPFPILLYNVPGRTASNISAATTIRLSTHPNIAGTKEAAGDLTQCSNILEEVSQDFLLISGDDSLTLPIISLGGCGVISVIANLQPKEFSTMVRAALDGNYEEARKINVKLLEGYELMSREGNPVSVKAGLEVMGLINSEVRLPLYRGSDELKKAFEGYLKK